MTVINKISPCLWFDTQAEAAARYYCAIFPNSDIKTIARFGAAGQEHHQMPIGSVMTVTFDLAGQEFMALNGGPIFKFNEAVSLMVYCDTQQEVDHYWDKLTVGGEPEAQQCGWLKDKFGVSWQIVPTVFNQIMASEDFPRAQRAMQSVMSMKRPIIAEILRAADAT